jgi:hypothetical protein
MGMKHLFLFETYTATLNSDYLPVVTDIPHIKSNCERLAEVFLEDLGKNYDLRSGKKFDKEIGNCAWFTQEFFRWCENQRLPVGIVYFPETKKAKDAHVAPYVGGLVIDFAHKQFSGNPKERFKVSEIKEYSKYGYDPTQVDILDEFPNWIESVHPLKKK